MSKSSRDRYSKEYDDINTLWKTYNKKQKNPLSLADCCCQFIRHQISPVTRSRLEKLSLPPAIVDRITKQKAIQDIIWELQQIHASKRI